MAITPQRVTGEGDRTRLMAFFSQLLIEKFVKETPVFRQDLWRQTIRKIESEWSALEPQERLWVEGHIDRLADLQQRLHALVVGLDGEEICRDCRGACCGHGLYHPTLVTVVAHIVKKQSLPHPDFHQSCPYLGPAGCLFQPDVRPFNCVIFICERIEDQCSSEQAALMRELERQLREIYHAFDRRYAGSNLRGLMNQVPGQDVPPFFVRLDVVD